MGRVIQAFAQYFDDDGDPLINGWLKFLESGSNNTLKNTYYDENLQVVNENPLQLDAAGRCPNVFGTGNYRVISYTKNFEDEDDVGEQIQVFDPVAAQGTTSGGGGGGGFEAWDSGTTYALGDIVTYNTKYYRSIIAVNLNLIPTIETASWEEIELLPVYNANVTYEATDLCHYQGNIYISLASLNTGNTPGAAPTYWRPVASDYYVTSSKTANYEILTTERDYLFILGSGTAGAIQFDLPLMDATFDRFRLGIYNDSDYDLTLDPLGTAAIWKSGETSIVIKPGVFAELYYDYATDTWLISGPVGSVFGYQDIGTSGDRVASIYATALDLSANALIGGTLGVTGVTSLSTLSTSGLATLHSLAVTNGATIGTTLGVTGAVTLSSTLEVTLATTLSASLTVGTTLGVTGATTLSSLSVGTTLGVTGATTLSTLGTSGLATLDSLAVTNGATIGTTLGVTGATTLSSTLDIGSGTTTRVAPSGTFANAANGNPVISAVQYDVDAQTEDTWVEVNPTTWTALASVPTDADWVEVSARISSTDGSVNSNVYAYIYARSASSSESKGINLICGTGDRADASGEAVAYGINTIKIPVSNRAFDCLWFSSFTNNAMLLTLTGYGFNP
jgi:hypothetical protein